MSLTNFNVRKISFFILGSLLFIVVLNLVFNLFRFPFLNVSPFEAIPNKSSIIIAQKSLDQTIFDDFNSGNPITTSIQEQLNEDRKSLIQLFGDSISNNEIQCLIAPQKVGIKNMEFLYVFDLKNQRLDFNNIKKDASFSLHKEVNFLGNKYYKLQTKNDVAISIYKFRNLVIVSKYSVLIEDAIRQLKDYRQNIFIDKDFKKIYKKHNNPESSTIYISLKNLSKSFASFFNAGDRGVLNALPNFASWVSFSANEFSLNQLHGDFINAHPHKLKDKKQSLRELSILNVIPENSGFLYAQQGVNLQGMKDTLVQQFLDPWFADEWAFSVVNSMSSADRLLFLKSKDPEYAEHYLEKYGMETGELFSDSYQTFSIKQLMASDVIMPFTNHLKLDLKSPFYTTIDSTVVFSKSKQALEQLIDKYIVGQTILQKEAFQYFLNDLSDESNSLLYFEWNSLYFLLKNMLKNDQLMVSDQLRNLFSKSATGGIEFQTDFNKTSFKSAFNFNEKGKQSTEILWRVALKNNISASPVPLWNTFNQQYEIIVQDDSNYLYLLNNSGDILWKRSLKEPLLSEIYQIDYFDDGNQMLFFNTASNIYLLDRNGNDIGNYPLRLQSPASNGMTVIDFKKNKNYQVFLACENGFAYGFTFEGNPVFGWNPKRNIGKVVQPFKHFQYEGKDHIVILNEEGNLTSFNSEGKSAFPKIALGKSFKNKPEILNIGKRKVIAVSNNRGGLKIIDSKGKSSDISFRKGKNENVKIAFANIVGDPAKDFVALDKHSVRCFYPKNKKMVQHFEIDFQYEQDEVFEVESRSNSYSSFGTLCKSKKQIFLFNSFNKLHKDFPLMGTTPFTLIDLFKNDNNILIVGVDNSVYAYNISTSHHVNN